MQIDDFKKEAMLILKAELSRQGITYTDLSLKLKAIGVDDSPKSIAMKIQRGAFTFAFFLSCMKAIGKKDVRLFD